MYLKIIRPSSLGYDSVLNDNIKDLEQKGFSVSYTQRQPDLLTPYCASVKDRLEDLLEAVTNPSYDYILCARGGYGGSDLLDHIPWSDLQSVTPKFIIGFSDVSALHSAFYTKLSWNALHAPMPASKLWSKNKRFLDRYLKFLGSGASSFTLPLDKNNSSSSSHLPIQGKLFGGCLSVLSSLIGTPYFPNLENHIVFLEDIRENPGSVGRMLNQWIQSGALRGVSAIVLGNFSHYGSSKDYSLLIKKVEEKTGICCFSSKYFGHISLNYPLLIGSTATITGSSLNWHR